MALINQIPTASPYQAGSTGYTATNATAEKATATGYTPTNTTAEKAESTGYNPDAFQVTPEQTVEGRLSGIIAKDSPLMQQARTRALQYANSRGLINSSLAAGEAQARMVDAAMPIAQQDASAFGQAMTNTVNAKNTASQFGANAENTASLTNAQLGTNVNLANQNAQNAAAGFKATAENAASQTNAQLGTSVNLANQNAVNAANQFGANAFNAASQTNAQLGTSVNLANMDAQTKVALANLDSQTRTELATIDGNYKQLLQTNQDAASAFNQVTQNLAAISQNASLSPEAKDTARNQQLNMLNELLRQQAHVASTSTGAISGLNLGGYFGAGDYGGSTSGAGSSGAGSTGSGGSTPPPVSPPISQGTPYWIGANGQTFFDERAAQESMTGYSLPGYTGGQLQPAGYVGGVSAPAGFTANPAIPGQYTRQVPIPTQAQPWMPYNGQQQYLTEEYGRGFLADGQYYPTVAQALEAMERNWRATNPQW